MNPLIDIEDGFHLNGYESSRESFILDPETQTRAVCKTTRNPYDLVAMAILIHAWQLAGKTISLRFVVRSCW